MINHSLKLTKDLELNDPDLESEISAALSAFAKAKISEQFDEPRPQTITLESNVAASVFKAERLPDAIAQDREIKVQLPEPDFLRDPLKFVTKFKHWCNKPAKFKDGTGNELQGMIRGLSFPTLQVEVGDTMVGVSPNDLQLIFDKK